MIAPALGTDGTVPPMPKPPADPPPAPKKRKTPGRPGTRLTEAQRIESGAGRMVWRPQAVTLAQLDDIAQAWGLGDRGRTQALTRLVSEAHEKLARDLAKTK